MASVILLSIITCGFYLLFWYARVYQELRFFTGRTPTDNDYGLDLLLVIITCGIWGIYVDYKISLAIYAYQKDHGLFASDTSMVAVVLDVVGYLSGYFTGIVSSAIHQDLLNGMVDHALGKNATNPPAPETKPSDPKPPSPWQ